MKKYIFTNLNEDELVFSDINELRRAVLEELKDLLLLKYNNIEYDDISDIINRIANTSSDGDLLDTIINCLEDFKRAVLEELKDSLLLKYNSDEYNDISDIINRIANTSSNGDLLDTIINCLNAFKDISPLKVVVEDD